uniref:C-type lectin domain-containing protein n=1 Tax=Gadus morhua TaxID=8049 RepID=A0A8C5AIR9_GADMO
MYNWFIFVILSFFNAYFHFFHNNRLSDSSFIYVHSRKSWWDAQSYCREHHTDLPSIRNMEENKLVYQIDTGLTWKWIGLHRNLWSMWSDGSDPSGHEPNNPRDREGCVRTLYGEWDIANCNDVHQFFCFDHNTNATGEATTLSGSNIVFIPKIKSWWDAQSYCRKHHTDLPSIRNLEENSLVYQIHNLQAWKWIGLHRNLRSTWSDGSNSSYRNWKDNIPPTRPAWTENNCTVALSNNGWQWADKQCNSKFNFLCNGGKICSILFQNSLTWSDAQSHCRQYGGDLATVHGPENQTRLVEVARKYNSHVWIGLYDDVESWTWSLSENANYREQNGLKHECSHTN